MLIPPPFTGYELHLEGLEAGADVAGAERGVRALGRQPQAVHEVLARPVHHLV